MKSGEVGRGRGINKVPTGRGVIKSCDLKTERSIRNTPFMGPNAGVGDRIIGYLLGRGGHRFFMDYPFSFSRKMAHWIFEPFLRNGKNGSYKKGDPKIIFDRG